MKKVLIIFICLVLFPIVVSAKQALTHREVISYINSETDGKKGFISTYYKYRNYLDTRTKQFYCAISGNKMNCSAKDGYKYGGLVSLDEYRIIGGRSSYLFDGMEYFTMNTDSSNVAYIAPSTEGYNWGNVNSME